MQQLEVINILKKELNFSNQSIDKLKEFANLVLKENISVILKDMKGNPSKNRLSIIVNLIIDDANDKLISTKQFTENFEYDVQDNKFNMKQYEKTISLNLTDKISQQIQTFLMNL